MYRLLSIFRKYTPEERRMSNFIYEVFGYTPNDIGLYILAVTHSSAVKKTPQGQKISNERLEFLGDGVIDIVVAEFLYKRYPNATEGELTQMKSKVVSRQALNELGSRIGLHEHIITGSGLNAVQDSLLGNALEALTGAIYLDKGFDFSKKKLLSLLSKTKINERINEVVDYKSKLNTWCQKEYKNLSFRVEDEKRDQGFTLYTVSIFIDNDKAGTGLGKSKKEAEQNASKNAWLTFFGGEKSA